MTVSQYINIFHFFKTDINGKYSLPSQFQLRSLDSKEKISGLPLCIGGIEIDIFGTSIFRKFANYEFYDNLIILEV